MGELDLTEHITINNHVGTEGCWEQAVYPLFNQLPREFEATFRIEHDTAILVSVSSEDQTNMPCSYAHSRLVYQFNSQFRKHQVENIFTNEKILILLSQRCEYDIIYKALELKSPLIICGYNEDTGQELRRVVTNGSREENVKDGQRIKVDIVPTLADAINLTPESKEIALCITFLNENGMINWSILSKYLSKELFLGVDYSEIEQLCSSVSVTIHFQLVHSAEIERRVISSDRNLPLGIKMENTLNSFQMPSYPLYPDIDWDKYMTPCSDVLHEILVVGSSEDIHFSKKCELSSDDITGVVWWAEVERDGFKEISNREIYVTKGFMEEINKENTVLEISGRFCVNLSPHLPDNCGVSFAW